MNLRTNYSAIPGKPLVWMTFVITLATLPNVGRISIFALVFLFAAMIARILMHRNRWSIPHPIIKTCLMGIGLGGVAMTFGTLFRVEAALSTVTILVAIKVLESNSVRDLQIVGLLGWFLALCALFFAQELLRCLYVGFVAWLNGAGMIQLHRDSAVPIRRSLRLGFGLFLQAVPIVALCFMFFPRSYGGFRFNFGTALQGSTGMSDKLEPGSFSSLAQNYTDVFRVYFPDGNIPPLSQMYWRGGVLWHGEGFAWSRGNSMYSERTQRRLAGPSVRQQITMEPHGEHWLFAMDRPESYRVEATFEAGGYLRSMRPVYSTLRYEVNSRPLERQKYILPDHRKAATQLPRVISPRLQELTDSWRAKNPNDRAILEQAQDWFRKGNFQYSLEPGTYGDNGLDDFLFNRRVGFCEHYASSFATLMRVAKIPARVVIGYLGGEYNPHGRYVTVRQSDAHAWCEVFLENEGWLRIDPTEIPAPDRIMGLEAYLNSRTGPGNEANAFGSSIFGFRDWMKDVRLMWDNVNFQWNLRVLGFDEDAQRTFFAQMGLPYGKWLRHAMWGAAFVVPLLFLLAWWLRWSHRGKRDALLEAYAAFCQRLAAFGVVRQPQEGPLQFADRAATLLPDRALQIRELSELYIQCRYARKPSPADKFVRAVSVWRKR